jgi:phosphoribosyl-AMP cyclohydrolase
VINQPTTFASPGSTEEVEEGRVFSPKFDTNGLVTCVVADVSSGEVLMVAHMNAAALAKTIETGDAWFYSRSRNKLWRKGETSGHAQRVAEMRVDCDQDTLLLRVAQQGPGACHTGRRSCFYRAVSLGKSPGQSASLTFVDADKAFDPEKVYNKPEK